MACLADIHLQLKPGTDGALALGMANVIIEEGLYDRDFVAEYTVGFPEYRAYVKDFSPERVEGITGVPAEKIREAARLYATTKPAAFMPSAAPVVHHTNGVQNLRAALALIGLTGNFDVTGGNVAVPPSWLEIGGAGFTTRQREFEMPCKWSDLPVASRELSASRCGPNSWIKARPWTCNGRSAPANRTLRGLMAFGMNYRMFPDSDGFIEALQKLDFICDVDLFLTDTAKYADIVLPACSSVERSELRCYPEKYVVLDPAGDRSRRGIPVGHGHSLRSGPAAQAGGPASQPGARRLCGAGCRLRGGFGLAVRAQRNDRGRAQEASRWHGRPGSSLEY